MYFREVLEIVDDEDVEFEEFSKAHFPPYDHQGPRVWNDANWIAGRYEAGPDSWQDTYMKLDTGAASVGVPSEIFFTGPNKQFFKSLPEKAC